jgi:hypothetical protein
MQLLRRNLRQSHKNGRIISVMIRYVVNPRRFRQKPRSLFEIDPHHERPRLRRFVSCHAREQFPAHLQRQRPIRCAILHSRQRQSYFPDRIQCDF